MLVGDVSERIPATRLVIEPDASCLPTMGMASLETPFIFNAARSPVFDLREGKAVSRWRNAFWRCGKRIFWTECWTGIDSQRSLRLYVVCRVPGEIKGAWLDDGGNGEDTAL